MSNRELYIWVLNASEIHDKINLKSWSSGAYSKKEHIISKALAFTLLSKNYVIQRNIKLPNNEVTYETTVDKGKLNINTLLKKLEKLV